MKFGKIKLWSGFGLTTKILIVFLALSIVSLVVIGFLAVRNIREVRDYTLKSSTSLGEHAISDSAKALKDQAEEHLLCLAKDQAAISNTLFEKAEAEINTIAKFASNLWGSPSSVGHRHSYSQKEKPEDIYASSVYVLAPSVSVNAVREELNLSSNMDDIFIPIYANNPNLVWVYIGTESGILRSYPWKSGIDPLFDPGVRDWYRRAKKTGNIGWTNPYIDVSTGKLMVTCSKSIYDSKDNLIGVVAADITIETINRRIINTQVGKLGYAYLMDNHGKVIARPGLSAEDKRWDETFEAENLLHSDNIELRKIVKDMTAGNTGIAKCKFGSNEKYIAYAPIACTKWSIGIVMPAKEIIAPALATRNQIISVIKDTSEYINRKINSMQNTFVGIFIIILLVVSSLAFLLSRMITRPVLKVTDAARAMEKGKLKEEDIASLSQSKGEDEVASLSRVFASMATQAKYRENHLKKEVKELQIKIDRAREAREVAKITENEYFQRLQEMARKMRERVKEE